MANMQYLALLRGINVGGGNIILREALAASEAMKSVTTKPGVDEAFVGPDVLYFTRLTARASQSLLARIVALPIYQEMTIRNWNTTSKLLALMDARGATVT